MRKVVRAFLGTALCLCLAGAVAVAAAPKGSGQSISVGDFAVELARAMNLQVQGGLNADSAIKSLRELGLNLGSPAGTLTEGELVKVLGQLGINVRTGNPGRAVTEAKASAVVRTFRGELGRAAGASGGASIEAKEDDDFNNGNGKGGKFKRKANLSPGGKGDD